MRAGNNKAVALCVLLIWAFFAGYALAESADLVNDAHERSSKSCETAVFSLEQAIKACDLTSNTLLHALPVNTILWNAPLLTRFEKAFSNLSSTVAGSSFPSARALPLNLRL